MATRAFLRHQPITGAQTYIDPQAVVIGNVTIGDDSSIWPFASVRGDMHTIKIGHRTSIQDGCVVHVTHAGQYNPEGHPVSIGSDVTVGHKATLHGCTILDLCIIGMDSCILDGAIVEHEVILGAGSLVPPGKILTSGYLWLGRPAVQKRPLTTEELNFIRYSARNYVNLKNQYLGKTDV